ncbi:MAG: NTP transferase domain-containing protein [Acidimicrobiales bacterium]|nr:NTP transferase domain-containing protein [Acidimicrobiales bacterium]
MTDDDLPDGGTPRLDRPWVVVVAGGSGSRFGAAKQFVEVAGRPVVAWSVAAARSLGGGVVLVVPAGREDDAPIGGADGSDVVVAGGASRSESVRSGLAAVPAGVEVVVVHDAARPAASPALFAAVVAAVDAGADAAVPGVDIVDSLRFRAGGTVDRDVLVAVQTPQAFRAPVLRAAHAAGGEASDDATLVEDAGGRVVVVPGEEANVKLTRPGDLDALARALGTAAVGA